MLSLFFGVHSPLIQMSKLNGSGRRPKRLGFVDIESRIIFVFTDGIRTKNNYSRGLICVKGFQLKTFLYRQKRYPLENF